MRTLFYQQSIFVWISTTTVFFIVLSLVTRALSQQLHKPLLRLSQSKSSDQTDTIAQVQLFYSEI